MPITDPLALPEEDTRFNDIFQILIKRLAPATNAFALTTGTPSYLCRAVHCNVSGLFRCKLEDSTGWVDLQLLAGVEYSIRVKEVSADSTAVCMGLY